MRSFRSSSGLIKVRAPRRRGQLRPRATADRRPPGDGNSTSPDGMSLTDFASIGFTGGMTGSFMALIMPVAPAASRRRPHHDRRRASDNWGKSGG